MPIFDRIALDGRTEAILVDITERLLAECEPDPDIWFLPEGDTYRGLRVLESFVKLPPSYKELKP